MHKSLVGLAAAAALGFTAVAAPAPANAGCYGCAVGAGIIGGVAAGAIIGSAIANSPPPSIIRVRAMRRWHPAAIGPSAKCGWKATATVGGPCKSVSDASLPVAGLPL